MEEPVARYIILVHRRDRSKPKTMSGVVKEVGKPGTRRFLGPESLWRILTTPWGRPGRKRRIPGHGSGGFVTLAGIMKQVADEDG